MGKVYVSYVEILIHKEQAKALYKHCITFHLCKYMRIQAQITENYSKDECPQQVKKTEELKQYMKAALRGPQEM